MWEKARVGWFERITLKHVYYHMWNRSLVQVQCMKQGTQSQYTGTIQRNGMGREVGGGLRMGDTCTPVADSHLLLLLLLLLSRFSHVRLCATPWTAAPQAPPSLGFSRQEHWSGLPLPSPKHESEKWKWSCSVVSDSSRPHGLQPTRLLHPWDLPGNSTGMGSTAFSSQTLNTRN